MNRHSYASDQFELDADHDGRVSLSEFSTYIKQNNLVFSDDEIDAMFKYLDADNSGFLSLAEVTFLFRLSIQEDESMGVRIRVVIPSTDAVSVALKDEDFEKRMHEIREIFCQTFGGCTAYPAQLGSYLAHDGSIVNEKVASLETFSTKVKWEKNETHIRNLIQGKCKAWGQECMALEINGVMEYVTPLEEDESISGEKLVKQLMTKVQMKATKKKTNPNELHNTRRHKDDPYHGIATFHDILNRELSKLG